MTAAATRPLVRVDDVRVGYLMVAITGSAKTRNLEYREGLVIGFDYKPVGTGTHEVKQAVIELASGEVVRTHRLADTF